MSIGVHPWFSNPSSEFGFSTIDGGGGNCAGGKLSLIGTVGQLGAGQSVGGSYFQQGGFLPGFIKSTLPALAITRIANGVRLTWPDTCQPIAVEAAATVDAATWTTLGAGTLSGSERRYDVAPPPAYRFFRLRKDCLPPVSVSAADDASQSAYGAGWIAGNNGGQGFGPWALNLSGPGSGGFVIGDSSQNGSGNSGHINTGAAKSWGMFASGGKDAEAIRPFTLPLAVDSTFTLDRDNGPVSLANENPGGFGPGRVGCSLRSGNTVRFELFISGTDLNYSIDDGAGPHSTGIPFTDGGLRVALTVTGAGNTYSATITPNGGTPVTFTGALQNGGAIDNVRFYSRYAGSAAARGLYFNPNAEADLQKETK